MNNINKKAMAIKSKNFKYNGTEYDFLYTYNDLATVEKYDDAERKMINGAKVLNDEVNNGTVSMVEKIQGVCKLYTDFIDEVLGNGTCNTLFGDSVAYTEVIKLKNTLQRYVAGRMSEENTAVEK